MKQGTPPFGRILPTVRGIAQYHDVSVEEILGRSHSRSIVRARHHCYFALRRRGLSYPEIGHWMDRDHSTVMSGIRRHQERLG